MEVLIGGTLHPVKITRKKMKNINLRISKEGEIRISCPRYATENDIRRLIYTNEAWILDQMLKRKRESEINREGISGDHLYWLGERKTIRHEPASRDSFTIDGDTAIFFLKEESEERITALFRKAAAKTVLRMAEEERGTWDQEICDKRGIARPSITMRYMTSRWGVCYPAKSRITLSTRLIHYPPECMEYVLLHEYTHLLVPNHSASFYRVVEHYMPDYRERRKRLK